MIRKIGTVHAPVEIVRSVYSDIESWPQWMPSVQATRILERSENRIVAEIDRLLAFGKKTGKFEFRFAADGHRERQLSGPVRRWESQWHFRDGPNETGTLVSCRIDLSVGIFGLFVSPARIQRWIDRTFEETLRGLQERSRIVGALSSDGETEVHSVSPVSSIQVFATPTGIELWIDDRKYLAYPAD